MINFIEYPKCSTCIKAKKFLKDHNIKFSDRHIVEDKLNKDEIKALHLKSNLDIKRFFNTSGNVYKSLKLKDKLPDMSLEEKYEVLASDGMLVKRPIVEGDDYVLVGFKENEYLNIK